MAGQNSETKKHEAGFIKRMFDKVNPMTILLEQVKKWSYVAEEKLQMYLYGRNPEDMDMKLSEEEKAKESAQRIILVRIDNTKESPTYGKTQIIILKREQVLFSIKDGYTGETAVEDCFDISSFLDNFTSTDKMNELGQLLLPGASQDEKTK